MHGKPQRVFCTEPLSCEPTEILRSPNFEVFAGDLVKVSDESEYIPPHLAKMAMSPLYSWLAIFAIAAAATCYYRPDLLAKILPQAARATEGPLSDGLRKRKSKPRRNFSGEQVGSGEGTSTPVSSTQDASTRRKTAAPSAADRPATGFEQQESTQSAAQNEDGILSNKEFAKQFTQARSGTPIASASGKSSVSKKDQRANKSMLPAKRKAGNHLETPNTLSDVSSTTGADGDDDLSSVGSPPLATTSEKVTKAGDVSDMLEAPSSGPAVLRLTDPKGTMNKARPKPAAKAFEAVETKKQRQARQKREAEKAVNEEAERVRRRLMEKQIRGARLAEGTSAQGKTNSFKAPTESAWFANNQGQAAAKQPSVPFVEELDVREPAIKPGSNGAVRVTIQPSQEESVDYMKEMLGIGQAEAHGVSSRANGTNGVRRMNSATNVATAEPASSEQSGTASWADDMMSEEEQLKMALEEQDPWMTVSSKKDKRKGGKTGESKDVSTTSEASLNPSRANGSKQRPSTNGVVKRNETSNRYVFDNEREATWEP